MLFFSLKIFSLDYSTEEDIKNNQKIIKRDICKNIQVYFCNIRDLVSKSFKLIEEEKLTEFQKEEVHIAFLENYTLKEEYNILKKQLLEAKKNLEERKKNLDETVKIISEFILRINMIDKKIREYGDKFIYIYELILKGILFYNFTDISEYQNIKTPFLHNIEFLKEPVILNTYLNTYLNEILIIIFEQCDSEECNKLYDHIIRNEKKEDKKFIYPIKKKLPFDTKNFYIIFN